jgi:predicted dehydrogenase
MKSTSEAIDAHYAKRTGKGTYKACACHGDFRDLLAREDIDAVVIATPDHWHVPVAIYAVRAGKDVYVEKPLGISVKWNQVLRAELKRTGAVFQFGTQQRSWKPFRRACELARGGYLGKLERVDVWAPGMRAPGHYERLYKDGGSTEPIPVPEGLDYEMWIGPAPLSPYTKNRCDHEGTNHVYDNSLGFIAGWGVHPLDIALWGLGTGAPVKIEGKGKIPQRGLYNTISDWDVHAAFANGVKLHFMNTRTAKEVVKYRPFHDHGTTFFGEDGWVSVDRKGLHASDPALLETKMENPLYESDDHSKNFLDCIRSRRETVSPFEAGFESYAVSHLSDLSIRLKRKIIWDSKKEIVTGDEEATARLDRPIRAPWEI